MKISLQNNGHYNAVTLSSTVGSHARRFCHLAVEFYCYSTTGALVGPVVMLCNTGLLTVTLSIYFKGLTGLRSQLCRQIHQLCTRFRKPFFMDLTWTEQVFVNAVNHL